MAKSPVDKLKNCKVYKEIHGESDLPEWALTEFNEFCNKIGFTYDRVKTISYWISLGMDKWADRYTNLKLLHSGTIEYQKLYHGEVLGVEKHKRSVTNKTAHFDHSSLKQAERAKKSVLKTKGSSTHSCRSKAHWINKGYSEEQATQKVREIQSTNTKANYIRKHGDKGEELFLKRKEDWKLRMQDPAICASRSLGLERYIARYGEVLGKQKYLQMRKARNEKSRVGKASNESIEIFSPIIEWLDSTKTEYYLGVPGNREWVIWDREAQQPYFYDLTIPKFSTIIEYHGEAFHPNPKWDNHKWACWKALFSNRSATEQHRIDCFKRQLAEKAGWSVYEVFPSDTDQINLVYNKLRDLANSKSSSGT